MDMKEHLKFFERMIPPGEKTSMVCHGSRIPACCCCFSVAAAEAVPAPAVAAAAAAVAAAVAPVVKRENANTDMPSLLPAQDGNQPVKIIINGTC
jgi:hypothetical protein